ncbi:MAG: hypothetical protein LC754_09795 [Acidobacteria bacterium]|nr:hypothetical protein [Acidobacteriota bacterium]
MNSFARGRAFVALLMVALFLASPLTALAKKGEKNYRRGVEYEKAQQWEKAAQELALAVAASPSDTEYQLHYRRAIFNASQIYMQKGRALADQGDYTGAYNAFRQAYGLDPVNELAADEMQRMLRLQREKEGVPPNAKEGGLDVSPTSFNRGATGSAASGASVATRGVAQPLDTLPPARTEQLRTINYNGELEPFIRKLAEELSLNVVFDQNFSQQKRTININWKDITAARALDYIFTSYGLFFQKLDRRTILVADQSKRPQYQQLVLRTFYLMNIKPNDARTLIQSSLPANAGRQPQVATNDATNSITVRDTPENIRIIAELLQSVDKDRAEVVMEVSIYEVSRQDLLQIGNQLGTADTLGNLGGIGTARFGGLRLLQGSGAAAAAVPSVLAGSLILPASTISALQSKDNTRLVFSTQVHAFDDEKSETRIGAKVPVQTASVFSGLSAQPTAGGGGSTGTTGVFGNGFPVIQYEDTGLSLDFTPKVYPNQDVQVKMVIETKDTSTTGSGAASQLTPTFTQRRITGVARIPNGKTMMIASIAQDRQSQGRAGLPLVGLIPILGRFFTTPRRNNSANDVVITMTPRVLRAPQITPQDEQITPSGSLQTPSSESLEAMLRQADREDQLADARKLPTTQSVQLPAPPQPSEEISYVPAPKTFSASTTATGTTETTNAAPPAVNASLKSAVVNGAAATPEKNTATPTPANIQPAPTASASPVSASASSAPPAAAESRAELLLVPEQQELKVGEKRRVLMLLKTDAPLGLATATLRFDPRIAAVRSVSAGTLNGDKTGAPVITQSVDPKGILLVSVSPAAGAQPLTGEGLLLVIEIEGLAAGDSVLSFDADKVHFIATDGRIVRAKVTESRLKVTQ